MVIHTEVVYIIAGRKMEQLDKVIMVMAIVQVAGSLALHLVKLKVKILVKLLLLLRDNLVVNMQL